MVTLTPWLRRTKWTKRFGGKDMENLFALTKKPIREEVHLYELWHRVDGVLRRCYKSVLDLDERGWELIPFWLASADANQESSKPFRMFFSKETLVDYISFWQRYICFCVRVITLQDHGVGFTEEETALLWKLHNIVFLERCTPEEEECAIMELSACLIRHSDYAGVRSSIIDFTGILGFDLQSHQWRQPENYAPILAGFQFCIQIIMLEHAIPIHERDYLYNPENP